MTTKKQIEEKIWDYFDKYNMATHEDEGGVPCADEIAQYIYDAIKNLKSEAIAEFVEWLQESEIINKSTDRRLAIVQAFIEGRMWKE